MKAAAAKKQASMSPALMRLANCFADAVVDDLVKQHEHELEAAAAKKQKRSTPGARERKRARVR